VTERGGRERESVCVYMCVCFVILLQFEEWTR
jgi:hypothetical protein